MPQTPDQAVFVLTTTTTTTTTTDGQNDYFTPCCACARGVIKSRQHSRYINCLSPLFNSATIASLSQFHRTCLPRISEPQISKAIRTGISSFTAMTALILSLSFYCIWNHFVHCQPPQLHEPDASVVMIISSRPFQYEQQKSATRASLL